MMRFLGSLFNLRLFEFHPQTEDEDEEPNIREYATSFLNRNRKQDEDRELLTRADSPSDICGRKKEGFDVMIIVIYWTCTGSFTINNLESMTHT
jgi:hypothetical protein